MELLVGVIITVLGAVMYIERRLRSIEKEIESTPPMRERLIILEGKTEEIKELQNIVESIKEKYGTMEGTLRVHNAIFAELKCRINKAN